MASLDPPPIIVAPARDGNIAIEEEFEQTRRQATLEAYNLFIERHPDHPLTGLARLEREKLRNSN